jgi:hypothetical protein
VADTAACAAVAGRLGELDGGIVIAHGSPLAATRRYPPPNRSETPVGRQKSVRFKLLCRRQTGTGDQNSPCQATISTNVLAGMSRDDATGSAGAEVLEGAAAGALATIAMSAAMFGFRRLGLMGEMPPEKITSGVLDRLGVRRSRIAQDLLASANHVAFGAGGGATFGLVRRWVPSSIPTPPLGVVFASAIWAVSYAGLAPILGLMPPPQKDRVGRPLSMIAAHLVYGTVLAFLVDRFSRRRAGSAAKPARPPAEPGRTRHPSRGGR